MDIYLDIQMGGKSRNLEFDHVHQLFDAYINDSLAKEFNGDTDIDQMDYIEAIILRLRAAQILAYAGQDVVRYKNIKNALSEQAIKAITDISKNYRNPLISQAALTFLDDYNAGDTPKHKSLFGVIDGGKPEDGLKP